ncbi:hypothetical protein ACJX0J_041719, partial [Zea mays]
MTSIVNCLLLMVLFTSLCNLLFNFHLRIAMRFFYPQHSIFLDGLPICCATGIFKPWHKLDQGKMIPLTCMILQGHWARRLLCSWFHEFSKKLNLFKKVNVLLIIIDVGGYLNMWKRKTSLIQDSVIVELN